MSLFTLLRRNCKRRYRRRFPANPELAMPDPLRHCGLDFGTSNTTLAATRDNAASRLLPLEDGKPTIPSTIFIDFDDDRTLYGRAAIAEYISGTDGRMMRSLKSILGSSLAEENVRIKKRIVSYLQIIGGFVGELKQDTETNHSNTLDSNENGRPVHYVDDDPIADRKAQEQME